VLGKNGVPTNISRGVELPSTLESYWNELAPRSKRVASSGENGQYTPAKKLNGKYVVDDSLTGSSTRKYCYWKQGMCNPGEEEFMTEPTSEHPDGKPECRQLTEIEPERLYQCLTGRHMYYCPSGEKACPVSEFNGCLGQESNLWRALNITYDEEPDDPFAPYYEIALGSECIDYPVTDDELIVSMEKSLDISNYLTNTTTYTEGVALCARECIRQDDIYNEVLSRTNDNLFSTTNSNTSTTAEATARRQRLLEETSSGDSTTPSGSTDGSVVVVKKRKEEHFVRPCTHFAFSWETGRKAKPENAICYWPGTPMECRDLIKTPKPDDEMRRVYDSYRVNTNPVVRAMLNDTNGTFYELNSERGETRMDGASLREIQLNMSIDLPSGGNVYYVYDHEKGYSDMTWNGTVWDTSTPKTCMRRCGSGYGGAKCDTCLPGYFRNSLSECTSCAAFGDRATSKKMFTFIGFGVFVISVFSLWIFLASNPSRTLDLCLGFNCLSSNKALEMIQLKKDQKEMLRRRHGRGSATLSTESNQDNDNPHEHHNLSFRSEKFKIMLTFIQIFSQFKMNYGVQWPYLTSTYMRYLSGFNLDIIRILPIDCIYRTNYYTVLLMTIFMPFVVLVVCVGVSAMGRLYYRYLILSLPRKCVKTGRLVRGWMPKQHYEQTLIRIAKNILLADDDQENDTLEAIRNKASELDEHYHQDIPPGISYLVRIRHSKSRLVQPDLYQEMITYNIHMLRVRVKERLHYNIFANKVWKILFWAILLGYPSVCMRVMRIYQCEEVGNQLLLKHDLTLLCNTQEWLTMTTGASIATVMYVVGAPLMFWYFLHSARNNKIEYTWKNALPFESRMKTLMVMAKADAQVMGLVWQDPHSMREQKACVVGYLRRRNMRMHRVQHRLGFLYYAYRDSRWWYECLELFRKFLLNGMVVVIKTGDSSQMMLGLTISFVYLMLVLRLKPHLASSDHALMVTTHVQLVVTLFCGLMLSEKLEYMSAFVTNRREARVKEVFALEMLIVVSHLGTVLFGMAAILYERYFSPEMYDIEKRRKHLSNLRKHVQAKVKRRWGGVKMKHKPILKKKKGFDNSLSGIAGFMAHEEEQLLAEDDIEIMTPMGKGLLKSLRSKGLLAKSKKKGSPLGGMFGMNLSKNKNKSKVSPLNNNNNNEQNNQEITMNEQLQALRDAQKSIGEETKKPLDFDWGDEHDDDDGLDSDENDTKSAEIDQKIASFSHKDLSDEEEEIEDNVFELHTVSDVSRFVEHMKYRASQIETSFDSLQDFVKTRAENMKQTYLNDRYDENAGIPTLHKMVKSKIMKLMDKGKNGNGISELHTYLDYVKEQALLRRAVGPVILKKATMKLTEMENNALTSLKNALGMNPDQHTEKLTLEEQEESLEKAVGSVMQCGRITSSIQAEPLLKAGIQMMIKVDKCRELNKMLSASLFGSEEALSSFSQLRSMQDVPMPLQNMIRAMFVLIGSSMKSVEEWNKTKKLCSPSGYTTLQKRIAETSPLLQNMTERVKNSMALTAGHENIAEIPTDKWIAGFACHTWVFGVMTACGMEDPRIAIKEKEEEEQEKNATIR
jgi:hypothetical protein